MVCRFGAHRPPRNGTALQAGNRYDAGMVGDPHDDIDIEAVRVRLIALRADLLDTGETSAESRQPVELDPSRVGRLSRMDALQGQAMALEIARRRANQVQCIDAALARIDEGAYGSCVTCGEDIAAKRLDLDPAAAVCIDCARG